MMDQETVDHFNASLDKGALGAGVFQTDDCQTTYEDLLAKGVEFVQPPQERSYGIEALFKDNSGNWCLV